MAKLRSNKDAVGIALQSLAHQPLIRKRTVALGGVKERNAPLDSLVYQTDASLLRRMFAPVIVQAHAAETHRRDGEGSLPATQRPRLAGDGGTRAIPLHRYHAYFCFFRLTQRWGGAESDAAQGRSLQETTAGKRLYVFHILLLILMMLQR